jgi:outer membrane receptor protein involved in Fe transport
MYEARFPYTAAYNLGTNNTQVFGLAEANNNPDVSWEKEKKLNIGLEVTLAQRLNIGLDIFRQNRYDILAAPNSTVPQYIGVALPLLNQGEVTNRGFEASIRYNSKPASAFQYMVEASGWYAQNRIVNNSEAIRLYDYQYTTGRPIGQPFGLQALVSSKIRPTLRRAPGKSLPLFSPAM